MSDEMTELDQLIQKHGGELSPAFYDRFLSSELFVKSAAETPSVVELSEGAILLAFDREERMGAFAPDGADCLILSGRSLVEMVQGKAVGIGLNLTQSEYGAIIPSQAVDWLSNSIAEPKLVSGDIAALMPPKHFPEGFLDVMADKFSAFAGLAVGAGFASALDQSENSFLVLGVFGADQTLEEPLARAVSETVGLQFQNGAELQILFLDADDPMQDNFKSVGWWITWPEAEKPSLGLNLGNDPKRPPKLR